MHATAEVTIRARTLRELFSERSFDPFEDDAGSLQSIAQLARLPDLQSNLEGKKLRVVLPPHEVSSRTQSEVEGAIARYASNEIAEARLGLAAWRGRARTVFFWSLGFFALSLLLVAGVQQALFLPEAARTLATETLIIAGWVVMWQPMDELIWGWLPIRDRERAFRTLSSMRVTVEPAIL